MGAGHLLALGGNPKALLKKVEKKVEYAGLDHLLSVFKRTQQAEDRAHHRNTAREAADCAEQLLTDPVRVMIRIAELTSSMLDRSEHTPALHFNHSCQIDRDTPLLFN